MRSLLLSSLIGLGTVACQTGAPSEPTSEVEAESPPGDPADSLKVGPATDDGLNKVLYKALEIRLNSLGKDSGHATEIGDFESFKFTVTRLAKGKDDAVGSEVPDNGEADVTGWYKAQDDKGASCTSFDATVKFVREGGEWRVPPGEEAAKFTREDGEDCF